MSPDERRFAFLLLDDSDHVRLFIELSSHAADLVEARDALELALRSMADPDSRLKEAERALVANAALAYCRTFFPSNVREPVTKHVEIPEEHSATHDLVGMYRNRTIAHSQSDLSVTYAVGVLDSDTLDALDVAAPNISSPMPPEQVRNFLNLVDAVRERLDDVIDPIRERLVRQLAAADRAALIAEGRTPAVRALWAADFGARTTRQRYPTSQPVYLTIEHDA